MFRDEAYANAVLGKSSEAVAVETPQEYVTTKEECERNIKGVCEGCGGPLIAIETVDNSGRPTFWQGCEHCSCFRSGVERRYFEVARKMVEEREITPYSHMDRLEYENTPERLNYYLDSQTAGLSHRIRKIHRLLEPGITLAPPPPPAVVQPATELSDEQLVQTLIECYARSFMYRESKPVHDRWVECKAEVLRRLTTAKDLYEALKMLLDGLPIFPDTDSPTTRISAHHLGLLTVGQIAAARTAIAKVGEGK